MPDSAKLKLEVLLKKSFVGNITYHKEIMNIVLLNKKTYRNQKKENPHGFDSLEKWCLNHLKIDITSRKKFISATKHNHISEMKFLTSIFDLVYLELTFTSELSKAAFALGL